MPTNRRICLFCGAEDSSAEHIWPRKLRRFTGPLADAYIERKKHTEVTPNLSRIDIVSHWRRHGRDATSTTRRIVCKECNNTWMSDLQNRAINVLAPLIEGNEATCSDEDLDTVAAFAALFAICRQYLDLKATHAVSPMDLESFYQAKAPNDHWRIWMAPYSGTSWAKNAAHYTLHVDMTSGVRAYLYCVTFVVGKVALHVHYYSIDGFSDHFHYPEMLPIWPLVPRSAVTRVDDNRLERIHYFMKNRLSPMQLVPPPPPYICGRSKRIRRLYD